MTKRSRHPARLLTKLARKLASLVALLSVMLAITACEGTGLGGFSSLSGEGRAERLAQNGEYADAAGAYIGLASEATGLERDRLTMLAVEQWLNARDIVRARNAFASVATPQAGSLLWLWTANSATFALYEGDPDAALDLLEPLSRQPMPLDHRLRIEALRADAWFQKEDPARAVEIMLQRENWLTRARERDENRQRLWQGLIVSSPQSLRSSAELALDPIVRGWLSLGALAAATGQQGVGWSNGVVRWREANAHHPAMTIIDDLQLSDLEPADYPGRIALLLPLSGNAANAGHAVQNGFFGAYFATAASINDSQTIQQTIRVYDVVAEGGASAAYTTAVMDGAEFVIGPLLRSNVSEVANDILVPVPLLTLNYLPENTLAPPGLYQFALAPEDEAVSAAERAIADGHRRAVALVPNSNWGRRVFTSFATAFEALGGTVLDQRSYATGNPDFSNTIEDLMALSGSVRRYQRLRANIGGPLQFDPRRRQDAEFIFLAADAPAGRLLKSQLKFHYSGDLPVYATSSIYAMDGRSNSDLNGVMFADTPWIIEPQPWIAQMPPLYQEYWPEQRRLGRLHAMGYDAYQLVGPLFAARGGMMNNIDGATGMLYVDIDGRVHRQLAWAQFQGGTPIALPNSYPDMSPLGGPIQDISDDSDVLQPNASDAELWNEPAPED
ncbi:MAG: penicillin-binding protein activator [Gammaproteobacteria bacterium]|nr:penicillin-binding protein activator [Gammaproteobacteria bacterium]